MAVKNEVKPGWKTTEFWLTVVVALGSLLWGADVLDPDAAGTANKVFGLVVSGLAAVGYTVSRGLAKKGQSMTWLTALIKAILEWLTAEVKKDTKAGDADAIPQSLKDSWRDRINRQLEKQKKQNEDSSKNTDDNSPTNQYRWLWKHASCIC